MCTKMNIRKATSCDLSRIAEIYVFNNRVNYLPIFKDPNFSFGELQVVSLIENYFSKDDILNHISVYDDGIVKGFIQMHHTEICKLYVDTFFQGNGIGGDLIEYAIDRYNADILWALEKNTKAISFYNKHGFHITGKKQFEEGTTEYLLEMRKKNRVGGYPLVE